MRISIITVLMGAFLLSACASPVRTAVPEALADQARVPGFDEIRYWGDAAPPRIETSAAESLEQIRRRYADRIARGETVEIDFLALSGGGGDGAFGAGLLNGWTKAGTRPEFQIVTGVSTGAIIAPLAFLGTGYDADLKEAYTEIGPSDVYQAAILPNMINGPALADTAPLRALVNRYATPQLMRDVAREHRKGRRLLVATTNLDAGRPVVWDLGAIAVSGRPDSLQLFRDVLLASSAIPGLFPPVAIQVRANGESYTELHADGGVTSQVFAYQPQVQLGQFLDAADFAVSLDIYVIRNGRGLPDYDSPRPVWYRLTNRSLDILLSYQAMSDITRIYYLAQRDGFNFHLALIPETFKCDAAKPFQQQYLRTLYDYGERLGEQGPPWLETPFEDAASATGLAPPACPDGK